MKTRVHTQMGPQHVDLEAFNSRARALGARCVVLPIIARECRGRVGEAMWDRFRHLGAHKVRRMQAQAQQRLDAILELFDREEPPWTEEEVHEARKLFRDNERDLSRLVGKPKASNIPDRPDLQIMVQARKLGPGDVYLFSNDVHFWGYKDLLEKWWGLRVERTGEIPGLLMGW